MAEQATHRCLKNKQLSEHFERRTLYGGRDYTNQSMTEGILTKLSPAPSYQNLGQRARPSAEVLQNSGMDTTQLRNKHKKSVKSANMQIE